MPKKFHGRKHEDGGEIVIPPSYVRTAVIVQLTAAQIDKLFPPTKAVVSSRERKQADIEALRRSLGH